LRRRRLQRDRAVRGLPRRRGRPPVRRRGRRRGEPRHRTAGRPPRRALLAARRRGRADRRRALHLCRSRLSGRRAGACVSPRHRPGRVPRGDRRRGVGRLPAAGRDRGDHPGAGASPRPRPRGGARRRGRRRLPLRPRRQGPGRGARPPQVSKTLVIYLMAGKDTPELAAAAEAGGADLVEIGFPFSDPLADGPVIRLAAERALAAGMRTKACLDCLAQTGARVQVPLVPMTYSSLLEAYGWERFADDARASGAASLIVADLPAGERRELRRVQLVAPTSTDERLRLAAEQTDGWLYLVTLTGTTGARAELSPALAGLVERARRATDK